VSAIWSSCARGGEMGRQSSFLVIAAAIGVSSTAVADQQTQTPLFRNDPPPALYRSGLPEVIAPRPQSDLDRERAAVVADFARAYRARQSPRIALFWNRHFDDRLSEWRGGVRVTTTEDVQLDAVRRPYDRGQGLAALHDGGEDSMGIRLQGRSATQLDVPNLAPSGHRLPETTEFELRSGFTQAMIEAGAVLVDRAAIMRLAQHRHGVGAVDSQHIETSALLGHADLLIEVVLGPSRRAPLDMTCQVNVKEVATGRIVASVVGCDTVSAESGEWQAVQGGFRRVEPTTTPREVGEQAAVETMAALGRSWR
jgi:hypothetical protein